MTPASVVVKRGSVHLTHETCQRYFPGLESVILLRRDNDLVIMPVRHAAGGGYILKLRNSAGDRVVTAADFFRQNGIEDTVELHLQAFWCAKQAGLEARDVFLQT